MAFSLRRIFHLTMTLSAWLLACCFSGSQNLAVVFFIVFYITGFM